MSFLVSLIVEVLEKLITYLVGAGMDWYKDYSLGKKVDNAKESVKEAKEKMESEDLETRLEGNKQNENFFNNLK